MGVAFIDIDEFKVLFNSRHGETKVDRNVLPRFMRSLEAHVAFHGQAYRQGGDEYMILLPGMSRELAITFLDELRHKQAALDYPDVEERTTISVGLCVADPDCPLTDRELREKANAAEAFAKHAGGIASPPFAPTSCSRTTCIWRRPPAVRPLSTRRMTASLGRAHSRDSSFHARRKRARNEKPLLPPSAAPVS